MFHSLSPHPAGRRRVPADPVLLGLECVYRHVTSCVARDFGIDPEILSAPTRGAPRVAFARQAAMYLMHVDFAVSFEAIGRMFGRDRTTVSHACRVIEDGRDDIWLDCRLAALELTCRGGVAADLSPSRRSRGTR